MAEALGLAAGFDLAMEAAGGEPVAPSQLGLFGAEIVDPDGVGDARPVSGAKGGRPPGARNRRSEEWCRWLLTRFRSPLIGMAELASADPIELATLLRCPPLEAARLMLQAQTSLAPYLHERRPQALELPNGAGFTLILNSGAADAGASAGTIAVMPISISEQGVSGLAVGVLDGASEGAGSE